MIGNMITTPIPSRSYRVIPIPITTLISVKRLNAFPFRLEIPWDPRDPRDSPWVAHISYRTLGTTKHEARFTDIAIQSQVFCELVIRFPLKMCLKCCHKIVCESGPWIASPLRRESSAAHENSTVVWRDSYTRTSHRHHVQAVSAGVQVFTRLCTAVSCRAMRTGRRRHGAPQSALRHSRSTKFPSLQHDKLILWPTSIFVRRPSCLELTARTFATITSIELFKRSLKNVFIRADIALSALQTFLLNGLYMFTHLLTLLT